MSKVIATYLVYDQKKNLAKKAESIALGLTVGSWTDLPAIDQQQLRLYKGEVVSIEELPIDQQADTYFDRELIKGLIKIAYPTRNFSADLPAILTTVFGKLSLDGEVKLIDLDFPVELAKQFPGPKLGVNGVRERLQVFDRPLLMSIFKSIIGRDLVFFETQLRAQALGGVDLVKDDEILFDNTLTPFEERIRVARAVLNETEQQTGERTLYAVNLTGHTFELLDKAKKAVELGADALLFNVFTYGLDVLQALSEDPEINIPILAHPAFGGAVTSSTFYGVSHSLWFGRFLRAVGADLVLFPSPYGSVALAKEAALGIAKELTQDSASWKTAFPVPSAGIHPALVPQLLADFQLDSVINAGGGIHGHEQGAAAGGRAFRQAITAAQANIPLSQAAKEHPELATALRQWGGQK
ncbi:2,3-diketo-5-methylthiopentyl-1-phosphate enolase [Seinonella peptonophila]|uniref:2,3-diketo-5-methylthiopentyl-1-phosphate enolase n=1 Tax=Seinonella peptonophila TaxID=112248 RepID=A0A1M4Z8F3_9BACL|nr:2,3-diketo-5-methylthiopentyl-1-phosphate enolase [Seinonella peptonophila]SHF14349.1 2,3-diketo-5-methylthiopentyl-1-phosphate enolase [Seinonella peptonophila]